MKRVQIKWDKARDAKLLACIAEELSSSLAAKALGCTRNAAIGRAYRKGWHFKGGHHHPFVGVARQPKPPKAPKAPRAKSQQLPPMTILESRDGPLRELTDVSSARLWTTRMTGECAYPVGTPIRPADQLSCCIQTVPGKPYCIGHTAIMANPNRGGLTFNAIERVTLYMARRYG